MCDCQNLSDEEAQAFDLEAKLVKDQRDRITVEGIRQLDDSLAVLSREGTSRLVRHLNLFSRFREMTPKQLVDTALDKLQTENVSEEFDHMVQELLTRVYPNWMNEEPS